MFADNGLALAMARPAGLRGRLVWIERTPGAARCLPRRPIRWGSIAVVMILAGAFGTMEVTRRVAASQPDGPAGRMAVTVMAKETGKPIEGAIVRTAYSSRPLLFRTDRDGKVAIDRADASGGVPVVLDVWAEGYVQQRHPFPRDRAGRTKVPAELTVSLLPGNETFGGRVTNEEGKPIAGVEVTIWGRPEVQLADHESIWDVTATTNDNGEWRSRSFRKPTSVSLSLSHPDYLSDGTERRRVLVVRGRTDSLPGAHPIEGLWDLTDVQVMTPGIEIIGRVIDTEGKPVAGAEVGWIAAARDLVIARDLAITATDAEGEFRFAHARPGRVVLQARSKGHAPELIVVPVVPGLGPITLRLAEGRDVGGVVVDADGKPISDASVYVWTWRGHRLLDVKLTTDAAGRFLWDEAPADAFEVEVYADGYVTRSEHRIDPAAGEPRITLRRALQIVGTVRDAETDRRIAQATAYVQHVGAAADVGFTRDAPALEHVLSGRLHVTIDADSAPEHRLRIVAEGYEPFESRAFRSEEREVSYDVKLSKAVVRPAVTLSGVVKRPDGKPLAGAQVSPTYADSYFNNRQPKVLLDRGEIRPRPGQSIATTDAEGRFTVEHLPDKEGRDYALVAAHPEFFGEVGGASFQADPVIVTRPWGRVEGIVMLGGKPAGGEMVEYHSDRDWPEDHPHAGDRGEIKADEAGRFVFERVAPGDLRVMAQFEGKPVTTTASFGTWVEVRSGETARVQVGGMGRPVIARIALPEGFDPQADYSTHSRFEIWGDRPLDPPYPAELKAPGRSAEASAWVARWRDTPEGREFRRDSFLAQGKLRPDGTIRVEDMPPGTYHLALTYSADAVRRSDRTAVRFASASVRFTIPPIPGERSDEPFDLGELRPEIGRSQ